MTSNNLTRHVWNMNRIRQFVSFANLERGKNNRPTDIDGLFELRDRLYIIFEAKLYGADLPFGQKLALTRLADDLSKVKPTLLIVANHDTPEGEAIDLASCQVSRFRYEGKWYEAPVDKFLSVGTMVDRFIAFVDKLFGERSKLPLDR